MSMQLPPDAKLLVRKWSGEREWLAARTDDYLTCSLGAGVPPLVAIRSAEYVRQGPEKASDWRLRTAGENAEAKRAWIAIQRWCLARGGSGPRETEWPSP
jgi:hypothetical protein